MNEETKQIEKTLLEDRQIKRDKNGKLLKGSVINPKGRNGYTTVLEVIKAIDDLGKNKDTNCVNHIAKRFYINDTVLIALLKKMLPDTFEGKGFGNTIIQLINYTKQQELNARNQAYSPSSGQSVPTS